MKKVFIFILDIFIILIILYWAYLLYNEFILLPENHDFMKFSIFNIKVLLFALCIIVSMSTIFYISIISKEKGIASDNISKNNEKENYKNIINSLSEIRQIVLMTNKESQKEKKIINNYNLVSILQNINRLLLLENNDDLYTSFIDFLHYQTNAKRISIFLYDDKRNVLFMKKNIGFGSDIKDIIVNSGLSWQAFTNKKRIFVTDIETHPEYARKNRSQYSTKSFIIVPIVDFKNNISGVINITEKTTNEGILTENDLEISSIIGILLGEKIAIK